MITQDKLKEYIHYCPDTGIFTWLKANSNYIKVGDIAGYLEDTGYIRIRFFSTLYRAHQLAFLYMEGYIPELIDHKDTNKSNTKWDNLRVGNYSNNTFNAARRIDNTSGIKGLSYSTTYKAYHAYVNCKGKRYQKYFKIIDYLSVELCLHEAVSWLQETRSKLHKEFAQHG